MKKGREMIETILSMIDNAGEAYDGSERVTQKDHAIQCGMLAEQAGAPAPLIAAAFLHDIGHLVGKGDLGLADRGVDARHEQIAAVFLADHFPPSVIEPIRMHVVAKRYLCQAEPDYFDTLSEASVTSLRVQGGTFNAEEAASFCRKPFAGDAIALRRWDDLAKDPEAEMVPLRHFETILQQVQLAD